VAQFLISLAAVLVLAALAWGIAVLLLGRDPGLEPAEPDGRAVPLPTSRPLTEGDLGTLRFDTAARGYRMVQVDSALRRAAYDIGYKEELIGVLEAEVAALREGRLDEAESLRVAREAAASPRVEEPDEPAEAVEPEDSVDGSVDMADSVDGSVDMADSVDGSVDMADSVEPDEAAAVGVGAGPVVGDSPAVGDLPEDPGPAKPAAVEDEPDDSVDEDLPAALAEPADSEK
jgi:DivIVA domain-containing protein